jgi:predicted nucleic acid-binding Zn ribbon protein
MNPMVHGIKQYRRTVRDIEIWKYICSERCDEVMSDEWWDDRWEKNEQ